MTVKVDIDAFVLDFCSGVKDRDLLEKYDISAKEMVKIVKQLINEGSLTKEQYFERTRKIEEMETKQEREFLKSLYQCPVCGHLHPTPFIRCPACGAEVSEVPESLSVPKGGASASGAADQPADSAEEEDLPEEAPEEDAPEPIPDRADAEPDKRRSHLKPVPKAPEHVEPADHEIPEELLNRIGMTLEEPDMVPHVSEGILIDQYRITEVVANTVRAAVYKVEDVDGEGPPLAVKLLHGEALEGADLGKVVRRIVRYQSNMADPNILLNLGTADLEGNRVLLYEYLPVNLSQVMEKHPHGLPLDLVQVLLPQILNGVGYAHTHRGKDGVIRRLPHMNLTVTKLLMNEELTLLKIDDFGVSRSLIDNRGHKKYLWQEPGADLGSISPEAYVMESKFVNGISLDVYALGVLLYQVVTGKHPVEAETFDEYKFAHIRKYPIPPRVHNYDLPAWLNEMILRCLEKEPGDRWRSATHMEVSIGKKRAT